MLLNGLFCSIIHFVPIFICKSYLSQGREVPERVSTGLVFFINIGQQVTLMLTALALYVTVLYLFPPPLAAVLNGNKDDDDKSTIKNLFRAFQENSAQETYAQHPWQIFMSRLLLAISIGSFLFMLERIIIVRIAMHFHVRTLQTEIEENKKALEAIKSLKRKVLGTSVHVRHDELGPA